MYYKYYVYKNAIVDWRSIIIYLNYLKYDYGDYKVSSLDINLVIWSNNINIWVKLFYFFIQGALFYSINLQKFSLSFVAFVDLYVIIFCENNNCNPYTTQVYSIRITLFAHISKRI